MLLSCTADGPSPSCPCPRFRFLLFLRNFRFDARCSGREAPPSRYLCRGRWTSASTTLCSSSTCRERETFASCCLCFRFVFVCARFVCLCFVFRECRCFLPCACVYCICGWCVHDVVLLCVHALGANFVDMRVHMYTCVSTICFCVRDVFIRVHTRVRVSVHGVRTFVPVPVFSRCIRVDRKMCVRVVVHALRRSVYAAFPPP